MRALVRVERARKIRDLRCLTPRDGWVYDGFLHRRHQVLEGLAREKTRVPGSEEQPTRARGTDWEIQTRITKVLQVTEEVGTRQRRSAEVSSGASVRQLQGWGYFCYEQTRRTD